MLCRIQAAEDREAPLPISPLMVFLEVRRRSQFNITGACLCVRVWVNAGTCLSFEEALYRLNICKSQHLVFKTINLLSPDVGETSDYCSSQ